MAPSRGISSAAISDTEDAGEAAVAQQTNSALASAKRNFNYFLNPSTTSNQPARFRTRALLRTLRYITQFLLWRLVRWAKYAAVGALVAAIGAGVAGSIASGVAWVAAPTGIMGSVLAYGVWGGGKIIARHLNQRWKQEGGDTGLEMRERAEDARLTGSVRESGELGSEMGPRAVPW